jgi:hypothetical protein
MRRVGWLRRVESIRWDTCRMDIVERFNVRVAESCRCIPLELGKASCRY